MALNINTNTTSLLAQQSLNKNISSLSKSIERLSSGLRVNRAADDAASLYIATTLDSQAQGLGQAVRNANDGLSIMQVIDGALEESVNILNSIKTKATQAAQDSQTTSTRRTIQSDIDKLIAELDVIAKSTSYNNQKLLSGVFSDKKFQIGAYSGEDVSVSLDSAASLQIGHVRTGKLSITNSTGGNVQLSFYSNLTNETLSIESVTVQYDNSAENSMDALATVINNYTDSTGISARAVVESTSTEAVTAGATNSNFAINDITIGAVTTQANDANSNLITAINNKTSSHGVTASITSTGALKLVSDDGRAIKVEGVGSALAAADASSMSTLGYLRLYQQGSYNLDMTDESAGMAVSFSSNMTFSGDITTSIDSTLSAGTILGTGSSLAASSITGLTLTGAVISGDIATAATSTIKSGSVLGSGSTIEKSSVLGGSVYTSSAISTTANTLLKTSSLLVSGSVLEAGTYVTTAFTAQGGSAIAAGTTLSTDTTTSGNVTLTSDLMLLNGSVITSGSQFTAGSYIGEDFTTSGAMTLSQDMTLKANSTIADVTGSTSLAAGSTIGGAVYFGDLATTTQTTTMKSGSVLGSTSSLAAGSTLGGDATLDDNRTTSADLSLASGSILASASILKTGTVLTNAVVTSGGSIASGTTLERDYWTSGSNTLTNAMTLKSGSVIASASLLKANAGGAATVQLVSETSLRLSDLSVLTSDDAQHAMVIADAALESINSLRSNAGSYQNQFSSTVSSLSTTKLNLTNAVSRIMDVDFAEETSNFAKLQVLTEMGAFALAQANAITGNVLNLLQGGSSN